MERTKDILRATTVSIVMFLIYGILSFWRTHIIIEYFGAEINSISELANQIFSYLVLLESGVGAAYLFKMYKPYSQNDYKKCYSLFLGLSKSLKKIAIKMFTVILIISMVYPLFLNKTTVTYIRASLIILLLGIRFTIPYYCIISRKNLNILAEKKYLNEFIDSTINSIIVLVEVFLIKQNFNIEIVLLVGIFFTMLSALIYKKYIDKKYKEFLSQDIKASFEAEEMTKDLMIHQICSLFNSHIDVIILSFINLSKVTIYSAYNMLITYATTFITKLVENLRGSMGLKIAKDDANSYDIFQEILALNFLIAAIIVTTFIQMSNSFVTIWIGQEYIIDMFSIILFAIILLNKLIINTVMIMRDSKGLYRESKGYTLCQALANLILSLILCRFFEMKGLLLGTVISTITILQPCTFYIVYKKVFNKKVFSIYKNYIITIICICFSSLITEYVFSLIGFAILETWKSFIVKTLITIGISSIVCIVIMIITNKYMKEVFNRLYRTLKNQINALRSKK